MTWRDEAACRHYPIEVFFPDPARGRNEQYVHAEAVAICRRCPVRDDCLMYALDAGETEGVWGGHVPSELARLAGRASTNRMRRHTCVVCEAVFYSRSGAAKYCVEHRPPAAASLRAETA